MVEGLPANAGDVGSVPHLGTKIPHTTGQLGPFSTVTEPARLELVLYNERSHHRKKPVLCNQGGAQHMANKESCI